MTQEQTAEHASVRLWRYRPRGTQWLAVAILIWALVVLAKYSLWVLAAIPLAVLMPFGHNRLQEELERELSTHARNGSCV